LPHETTLRPDEKATFNITVCIVDETPPALPNDRLMVDCRINGEYKLCIFDDDDDDDSGDREEFQAVYDRQTMQKERMFFSVRLDDYLEENLGLVARVVLVDIEEHAEAQNGTDFHEWTGNSDSDDIPSQAEEELACQTSDSDPGLPLRPPAQPCFCFRDRDPYFGETSPESTDNSE
jgi:hypothetical protein